MKNIDVVKHGVRVVHLHARNLWKNEQRGQGCGTELVITHVDMSQAHAYVKLERCEICLGG
jgi:hypothetical protein